ncbi:class I SAM-dependent methyltransferase [Staphylospora marina]|uniref:class I SAM-dependent methyltransferase n=1 Tax=Staphylospora marina TaxID=2490858 RepID=UPI000F5BDA18|nr:class I SAM-dependent methyltransferase [Staphylospora marina]
MEEKREVKRQFGQSAEKYADSQVHAKGKDLDWIREIVAGKKPRHSLDVATGAGHAAFVLSESSERVTALDLTPEMLEVAAAGAGKRKLTNIRFVLGDAEALPFADGEFDVVSCRIAAHHFPDVDRAIREMHRVLAGDGLLILVDNVVPDDPENATWLNKVEKLRDPSHVRCLTAGEWRRLFALTGFRNVECRHVWTTDMYIPDWLDRMNTPPGRRKEIFELLEQVGPRPWIAPDGRHIVLQKALWVCVK